MNRSTQSKESIESREPMRMVCSTCSRNFLLDETEAPPFCSQRCRMIDLGRWLDEDIGVPHEGGHEAERIEYHSESEEDESQ